MRLDHNGRYSPRSATRSSVSASAIGTSAHASSSPPYLATGYTRRARRLRAAASAAA
jgi:hypothetical protein